jgi:signal transduction histidine kinase
MTYFTYVVVYDGTVDKTKIVLESEAFQRSNAIKLVLDLRTQQLQTLSGVKSVQEIFGNNKFDDLPKDIAEDFKIELKEFQESTGGVDGFRNYNFIDKTGKVIFSTGIFNIGEDMSKDPHFIRGLNESFTVFTHDGDTRLNKITVPVYDHSLEHKNSIGVITAEIPSKLVDTVLLNRHGLGNTGESYLVDKNSILISDSRFNDYKKFKQIVDTQPISECFDNDHNITSLYPDYRGIQVFGSSICENELGYVLLVEIDKSEVDSILQPFIEEIMLISMIIVGSIIAFIMMYMRFFSRPIERLVNTCKNYDVTNLQEIDIKSKGEINDIVKALNSLISRARENEKQIECNVIEIQEKTKKMERLATIGELASRLTHNLRNPLSVINATTDVMEMTSNDTLDKKTLERIKRIKESAQNMSKQIEDVLTFVKEKPLDLDNRSLLKIIHSAMNNMIIPKSIHIEIPDKDYLIKCDDSKLQVVFMNMITNAIQAIGDNEGTINIRAILSHNSLIIEMQDSGSGISSEVRSKIFDTLFTTKPSGTGLGLPYCKSVIEQHGGTLTVEINPTVFTFTFPNSLVVPKINTF